MTRHTPDLDIPDPPHPWRAIEMRSPPPTRSSELAAARRDYELACQWAEYATQVREDFRPSYIKMAREYAASSEAHEAEAARLWRK
jgi:hypothetical protein